MKCKMESKLNAYLENELSTKETLRLKEHLKSCSICRQTLKELQEIDTFLKQYVEKEVPEKIIASIYDKIQIPQKNQHRIVNFGVAAAILLSFFSGLWFSDKVFSQTNSNQQLFEIGSESLYSYIDWEE